MLKGLLAAGATCALVGGVAVAGHAAQAPSAAGAPAAARVALTSSTTAPAAAGTATTAKPRANQRCERLPQRIARAEKLERTLAAGASTTGSTAHLRGRIDKARAAHNDRLVATLQKRLEFRTALQRFLPQRLELLRTASTTVCAPDAAGSSS